MIYIYCQLGHPFYQYGHSYDLVIRRTWLGRIVIYVVCGRFGERIKDGSYIKYKNFKAFKAEWRETEEGGH